VSAVPRQNEWWTGIPSLSTNEKAEPMLGFLHLEAAIILQVNTQIPEQTE